LPIANYSVLKGDPQSGQVVFGAGGKTAHYRIHLNVQSGSAEADVNIQSSDGSEVLYVVYGPFTPPNPGALGDLPFGITPLDAVSGTLALDYVREMVGSEMMVNRADMSLLPEPTQNPQDQLKNAVISLLNEAVKDPDGAIYAFGSSFSDSDGVTGVHNIHMNQGNPPGQFESDNGVWQDGAVFVALPASNAWKAIFIAFQTESWQTDSQGDPLPN
jgi:uncharacterized protein YukJ